MTVGVLESSPNTLRNSEIAREPQTCFHVCVTPDQEIAGFVRGRLLPEGGLDDFIEHRLEEIPEDLAKAEEMIAEDRCQRSEVR